MRGEAFQDDALQPVLLGVVVRFAENDVTNCRKAIHENVLRNKVAGARVPYLADERIRFCSRLLRAGGHKQDC